MNSPSTPFILRPSRTLTGRVWPALGDLLRSAKRALLLHWRDQQTRRREARAFHAISEMDAHMLRDIGAPAELISRAAEGRGAHYWKDVPLRMSMVLVAIAVIATVAPTPAAEAAGPQATGKPCAPPQMVGVFTGEFVDGAPVYRFPSVTVAGSRRADPARNEEPVAQRRPARAATARDPG